MRTSHVTTLTTVALTALLVGCAGSTEPGGSDETSPSAAPSTTEVPAVPSVAETSFPGAPGDVTGEEVTVVADADPRQVQVVTYGSSTCPVLPTAITWDDGTEVLSITLSGPEMYDRPCTMDFVPTTSVVALPDDAPDAAGLTVEVDGRSLVVE